ncbi:hypothetical protein LINGRAHAP2_LOCUS23914, partial [Linum grandiflorum]
IQPSSVSIPILLPNPSAARGEDLTRRLLYLLEGGSDEDCFSGGEPGAREADISWYFWEDLRCRS